MKKAEQGRSLLALVMILAVVGAIFYSFNLVTPLIFDDYTYAFSWASGQRIHTVGDIFHSLYAHYFKHSGRLVAHFFAQLFLSMDKAVFNVINTGVFLLLGMLIHHLSGFRFQRPSPSFLLLAFVLIYWFCPGFGEGFLWLTGSCNYLFSIVILFLFYIPFHRHLLSPTAPAKKGTAIWQALAAFLIGFLCGDTHESNALAMICMISMVLLISLIRRDFRPWIGAGAAGMITGFLFLILSPGGSSPNTNSDNLLMRIFPNILTITQSAVDSILPLLLLYVLILVLFLLLNRDLPLEEKAKKLLPAAIFFLGFLANAYSMAASTYFPVRAWNSPLIYLIISIGCLLKEIDFPEKTSPVLTGLCSLVIALCISIHCFGTYQMLSDHNRQYQERAASIDQQISQGNRDIEIPAIFGDWRFSIFPDYGDLDDDPNHWINSAYARYLGVDHVVKTPKGRLP